MPDFRYAQGRIPETVAFISEEIREFDADYAEKTWKDYRDDRKLQKLMDRTVENVLTALVEACGTILSQEGTAVESYAEALSRAGKLFGFTEEEQQRLEKLAIQRNRLAHRYLAFAGRPSVFSRGRGPSFAGSFPTFSPERKGEMICSLLRVPVLENSVQFPGVSADARPRSRASSAWARAGS